MKPLMTLMYFFLQGGRLLSAAENGDLSEVLGSLQDGIQINFRDPVSISPITISRSALFQLSPSLQNISLASSHC